MKINRCLFFTIAVFIFISASAQQEKIKFKSIISGGITYGEIGTFTTLQSINGVQNKKWFAGIGAGYDDYYYRSIPLFLDARRFIDKQNNLFAYADAGYNFPWKDTPKEMRFYSSYKFSGNFYGDVGLGYNARLLKNTSFIFTTGYSYKLLSNKIEVINPCLIGPCPGDVYNYNYIFRRIIIKAGIMF